MLTLLRAMALGGGEWVIYLLIICSILTVAILIEKFIILRRERKENEKIKHRFYELIDKNNWTELAGVLSPFKGSSARMLSSALECIGQGKLEIQEKIEVMSTYERRRLEVRMIILGTLGNNAVYVGLFGTVLGVIKAFHDLSSEGSSGPEVVMQGLSEALLATAVGLMVALPCVVGYNIFQKQIKDLLIDSESMVKILLARVFPSDTSVRS